MEFINMFVLPLILLSLQQCIAAQPTVDDCQNVHRLNASTTLSMTGELFTSTEDSICFNNETLHVPSCCSTHMENYWKNVSSDSLKNKLEQYMENMQTTTENHNAEFNQFVIDVIEKSRSKTHDKLLTSYGALFQHMEESFDTLFNNMNIYFEEGAVSVEDMVGSYVESIYVLLIRFVFASQLTDEQVECAVRVLEMNPASNADIGVKKEIKRILKSALLNVRAYSQGLYNIVRVFRRIKRMSLTDECKENIVKSTYCSYCKGHGDNIPICLLTCTNVYNGCLHLQQDFLNTWESYVDAMLGVSINIEHGQVGSLLAFESGMDAINIYLSDLILEFSNETTTYGISNIPSICGLNRRKRSISNVGYNQQYHGEGKGRRSRDVSRSSNVGTILDKTTVMLYNFTEVFKNLSNMMCSDSSIEERNCWSGRNIEQYDHDIFEASFHSTTPSPDVLLQINTLDRLSHKLTRTATRGIESFSPLIRQAERRDNTDADNSHNERELELTTNIISTIDSITPTQPMSVECPPNSHLFNLNCYLKISASTFAEARSTCQQHWGELVSIESDEENMFVTVLVEKEKAWIGAAKDDSGQLHWLNGEEWFYERTASSIYLVESCAETNHVGLGIWSTAPCDIRKTAVCEIPL